MTTPGDTRGFTLVEVLVALLVLEVGILAAAGTLLVAARTLRRSEAEARAVNVVESVLDSLQGGADAGAFARVTAEGTLSGSVSEDGTVRIRYRSGREGVVVTVEGAAPVATGVGP
jgi:prepilin-type N-terminal cleavage/methylation domain-containing protein